MINEVIIVADLQLLGFFFPCCQSGPEDVRAGFPDREGLLSSLMARQHGRLPGSPVNYINALIPFHFPAFQLAPVGIKQAK